MNILTISLNQALYRDGKVEEMIDVANQKRSLISAALTD